MSNTPPLSLAWPCFRNPFTHTFFNTPCGNFTERPREHGGSKFACHFWSQPSQVPKNNIMASKLGCAPVPQGLCSFLEFYRVFFCRKSCLTNPPGYIKQWVGGGKKNSKVLHCKIETVLPYNQRIWRSVFFNLAMFCCCFLLKLTLYL